MSEQTFDQQIVTQYLLGALPEAEADRLDELSVSDDDFAAALSAAEKDLVDAYVQGELTGTALAQFKSHYLASSLRREKVKFAQAFQFFAEQNTDGRAEIHVGTTDSPLGRKDSGWFSGLGAPRARFALRWGLAGLALLITGGWLALSVRLRRDVGYASESRPSIAARTGTTEGGSHLSVPPAQTEEKGARASRTRAWNKLQASGREAISSRRSIVSLILAPPARGRRCPLSLSNQRPIGRGPHGKPGLLSYRVAD